MAVSPQIKMAYIVTLYGGTPWGFRIHGGIDSNEPIRISKVNPNSKSFREGVQVGDIIYKINGDVVDGLTLVEAQRHIKAVGNTLELELKRGEDGVEGQGTGEANKENKVRGQPKQTTKQEDDMFKSSTSISINHHPSGAEHNDTAAQENAARAERARMRLQRREASRQQQQQLQHSSERGRPFYRSFTPQPDSRSMGTSRGIGRSDSVESLPVYTMHVPDSVANYCTIRPKPRVNEWKPMSKYGSVSRSYKPVSFNKGADSLSNRSGSSQSSGMTMGLDSLIAKEREFENLANFDEPVTNNVPNSSHSAPSDNEWWRRRESASRDEQSSKGAKMFMKMQEKSRVEEDVEPPQSPWRNQTQEAPHQQGYHSHQQPQQQPSGPWRSQSVEGPQQGYQSQESQPQQQRPSSPWRNQSFDGPQQHPPSQWRNQSNDLQKRPVSPMRNQTIPQQHQQPSSPMRNQSYGAPQSRRPVSPVRNQSAPQQHQRPTSPMKNQSYDSTQRQRPSSPWRSQSFDVPERQRPMSPMSQQRPSSPWMNKPSETKHMTSWQSQPQEAKPPMQTPLSPCRSRTHETPVSQPPTPRPATRSSSVPARARSAPSTPRGQPPKSTQPPSAVVPPMPSGVPVPVNRAPTPAQSEAEEEVVPVKDRIKSFRNIEAAQSPTKQQQKFSTDYNPKPNFSSQPSTPTWNVRAPSPVSFNKHSSGAPTPSTPSSSAPWSKPTSTWVPTKPPSTPTWSGQSQTLPRDFHRSDSLPPPSLDPVPLTMNWKKREEEKNVKNLGAEDDVWRSASRDFLTMTIPKSQKVDSRLQQNGTSDYPSTSEAPVLKASQSSLNAAPKSNLLDSKPGIWTPGQRPPDLSNDLDERERDNERDKERINELKSANKTWTPSGTLPKDFRSRKLESSEPVKFEPPPVKFESVAPREPPKSEPLPPREPPAAQPSVKASSLPEPEVAASKSEENHAPPPERAFSTPSLPASTSLAHSPSKPFSTMNGSISSLDGRHSPTLHLPKTQTPAITLLQKYRDEEASTKPPPDTHPSISDGQIPKGAIYVGSKDHVDGEVKHTDTYYILPSGEKQVTSTKTEKKAPKYEGIGPTNEAGLPIAFRSTIDEKNQHDWYKTFYKTLHKTDKPRPGDLFRNEGVFVNSKEEEENTYRPTYTFPEDEPTPFKKEAEEENPYVPSYAKLPQNSKDDSYSTLERDRMKSYTHEAYGSKGSSTWSPAHARSKLEIYKNQPRKIEDYEPGYSSIADKEIQTKKAYLNKLEKFKAEKVYDIQRSEKDFPDESTFYNPPIEKPGQNSQYILDPDRRLPTKNSERSSRSTSPTQAHEWYKQVLKGGEIPQEGFRRPYPERKDLHDRTRRGHDTTHQKDSNQKARNLHGFLTRDITDRHVIHCHNHICIEPRKKYSPYHNSFGSNSNLTKSISVPSFASQNDKLLCPIDESIREYNSLPKQKSSPRHSGKNGYIVGKRCLPVPTRRNDTDNFSFLKAEFGSDPSVFDTVLTSLYADSSNSGVQDIMEYRSSQKDTWGKDNSRKWASDDALDRGSGVKKQVNSRGQGQKDLREFEAAKPRSQHGVTVRMSQLDKSKDKDAKGRGFDYGQRETPKESIRGKILQFSSGDEPNLNRNRSQSERSLADSNISVEDEFKRPEVQVLLRKYNPQSHDFSDFDSNEALWPPETEPKAWREAYRQKVESHYKRLASVDPSVESSGYHSEAPPSSDNSSQHLSPRRYQLGISLDDWQAVDHERSISVEKDAEEEPCAQQVAVQSHVKPYFGDEVDQGLPGAEQTVQSKVKPHNDNRQPEWEKSNVQQNSVRSKVMPYNDKSVNDREWNRPSITMPSKSAIRSSSPSLRDTDHLSKRDSVMKEIRPSRNLPSDKVPYQFPSPHRRPDSTHQDSPIQKMEYSSQKHSALSNIKRDRSPNRSKRGPDIDNDSSTADYLNPNSSYDSLGMDLYRSRIAMAQKGGATVSECSERSSRIDPQTYQSYTAGILHSSEKSEKFMSMQKYYSTLERISEIEKNVQRDRAFTPSLRRIKSKKTEKAKEMSRMKLDELEELQDLYGDLHEAQKKDGFMFDLGNLENVQWQPEREWGLMRKPKSLGDLVKVYEQESEPLNTRLLKKDYSENPNFKRDLSFMRLCEKYKNLDEEAKKEHSLQEFIKLQSSGSRRNSNSSIQSTPVYTGTHTGSYIDIMEKPKPRPLYGANIPDAPVDDFEVYVSSKMQAAKQKDQQQPLHVRSVSAPHDDEAESEPKNTSLHHSDSYKSSKFKSPERKKREFNVNQQEGSDTKDVKEKKSESREDLPFKSYQSRLSPSYSYEMPRAKAKAYESVPSKDLPFSDNHDKSDSSVSPRDFFEQNHSGGSPQISPRAVDNSFKSVSQQRETITPNTSGNNNESKRNHSSSHRTPQQPYMYRRPVEEVSIPKSVSQTFSSPPDGVTPSKHDGHAPSGGKGAGILKPAPEISNRTNQWKQEPKIENLDLRYPSDGRDALKSNEAHPKFVIAGYTSRQPNYSTPKPERDLSPNRSSSGKSLDQTSQRHHHSTSDLPSHKSPVGTLERHHSSTLDRRRRDEEEARRKEYLRQITEEEKRKRAEEEYARNEARKHSDFFSAKQKSPIPIDRFGEDLENMAPMHVPKFDKKHRPTEIKGKAKALYSFKSQSQKELSFRKGDVIYLTRQVDKNWYEGEHHGHRGIFPVNYVEITKTLEEARAIALSQEGTAKIKYTFKKQSPVELSAKKGAIATLIRRVDENWYEAKVDGIQGIIPISYLDIQREPDTPFITPAPSVVQSAAPSAFNTPGPGTPVRPMSPLYPDQMMSPSQNRENYFDFQDYSPRQDRRQRYDSSSKDGDYNQTLDSFIDTLDKRDSTSHRQDHSPTKRDGHRNVSQDYNPRLDAASAMIETYKLQQKEKESRPAYDRTLSLDRRSMGRDGYYRDKEGPPPPQPKHEQPLKPYRAVFAYGPQNQDELDLREGDSVYVLERCDDGWFVGTNARTGQFGTFPGNYVQPV
ncbi:uncharacterized protein LOC135486484 isoform X8 [Lineus longissimus]|uniref:uncharacterized protein LOC135486484 isoform X8 n=1 Tax=Lineus longissimus TaxID=88925 RepID=UPI00315D030D